MKIIHIADFHLNSEKLEVSHQRVLDALILDLKTQEITDESILIFSGDFLNLGGSNFKEPTNAFKIFEDIVLGKIYDVFPLLRNKTFFVPGNHDLDRRKIKVTDKAIKKQIIENYDDRSAIYEEMKSNIVGLVDYNGFKNDFYADIIFDEKELTNFENNFILTIESEKVGITTLNTATFCYEKDDFGNLILFEKQLKNSLQLIADCTTKIAVMHHPINFFHKSEIEKITEFLEKEYDLVFFGHTHKLESAFNQSLNGNCYFSVGKSLNGDTNQDTIYTNGYSIIDLEPNKTLLVSLRKFNNKNTLFP